MISRLKFNHYFRLLKQNNNIFKKQRLEKFYNYAKYKCVKFGPVIDIDKVAPVYTSIIATKRCNLSCEFCVVGKMLQNENKEYDLTIAQAKRILSNKIISKSLMIMFTGGEPLLNKNLPEIVKLFKSYGHIVSVTTNGLLLDRKIDELICAGIDSIGISVYDSNFTILCEKLRKLTNSFPIRLNKVISRYDVERFPENIEKAVKLGIETGCYGIIFQNIMPVNKSDTQKVIFSKNLSYQKLKKKVSAKYGHLIQIDWAGEAPGTIHRAKNKKCRQLWYLNVIDSMGNLGLCCRCQEPVYGNIFDHPRKEIRNNDYWRRLRRQLLDDSSVLPKECIDCYRLGDTLSADV